MKNLISTIALCVFMTPAVATANSDAAEICPLMGQLAGAIMEGRQIGVPLSAMLQAHAANDLATEMTKQAFERTRWHSDGAQQREIEDFTEFWEVTCYKAFGDEA